MVLLRAGLDDFEQLIAQRRRGAIAPVLICGLIATAIIVAEYRLMLIAFVMITPAIVAIIDAVMVGKAARVLGACEVRIEGEWIIFNQETRLGVAEVLLVRSEPDSVSLVYRPPVGKLRRHLVAGNREKQQPLLDALRARGCKVQVDNQSIATLGAFLFAVLANLILDKVAGVLVLGALAYTVKGFVDGPGPGWEAGACFGGAVLALTIKLLMDHFLKRTAAQANPPA